MTHVIRNPAVSNPIPTPNGEIWTYNRCILLNCIDGDTIDVNIDLGFGTSRSLESIRFYGINAPEKNTPEGKASRQRLIEIMGNQNFVLSTIKDKREKYGRMLGIITLATGVVVNQQMVDEGFAKVWDGKGPRP